MKLTNYSILKCYNFLRSNGDDVCVTRRDACSLSWTQPWNAFASMSPDFRLSQLQRLQLFDHRLLQWRLVNVLTLSNNKRNVIRLESASHNPFTTSHSLGNFLNPQQSFHLLQIFITPNILHQIRPFLHQASYSDLLKLSIYYTKHFTPVTL